MRSDPMSSPSPSPSSPTRSLGGFARRKASLAAFALAAAAVGCAGCSREQDTPAPAPGTRPTAPSAAGDGAQASATSGVPSPGAAPAGPGAPGAPGAPGTAAAATPPAGAPSKLNVLLLSVDSMRADMPWMGYGRDIAPVMTAFAKKAVSYTRFYSVSSYTAMSLGGMLAGRYPSELNRSGYFFGNYPDESVVMFPELLQKAGVKTLTGHAHFYFDVKSGFRQGFDVYKMVPDLKADNTTDNNITSPQHLELAKEILSDKGSTTEPFFAWFHLLDPHDQYMSHEGISWGKKTRDRYDGEITFTDQHIGKLLDFVAQQPWGARTAVMITSDHGEAFGEHKMFRHGFEVWEMLVHVPLMIQAPGITPRQIDVPRSGIDIAPTVMELTGAPKEASLQGTSLVPELYGKPAEPRDVIVDLPRTSDNDRRRALIRGSYKLTAYGDDEGYDLFDIVKDPGETKDIKREQKEVFEEMKQAYKQKSASIIDVCPKMTEKLKGKRKGKKC